MTKKLFISIIAIVVIAAVVGTCFAVYSVTDTRSATITVGNDAVDLSIGTVADNFVLSGLQPTHTYYEDNILKTYSGINQVVTLSASAGSLALIENSAEGEFSVTVEALTNAEADEALAAAVIVSATDYNNVDYNATQLANGVVINLKTIPQNFTINFCLPEEGDDYLNTPEDDTDDFDFMAVAEGSLRITFSWEAIPFSVSDSAYYVIGTVTGVTEWNQVTANAYKLGPGVTNGDHAQATGLLFFAGDTVKVHKNNDTGNFNAAANWFGGQDGNTEYNEEAQSDRITTSAGNNIVINESGYYNVFVNSSDQVWFTFVSAYVEP